MPSEPAQKYFPLISSQSKRVYHVVCGWQVNMHLIPLTLTVLRIAHVSIRLRHCQRQRIVRRLLRAVVERRRRSISVVLKRRKTTF